MSKDLPKMYQNTFNKEINNNRCIYSSLLDRNELKQNKKNIKKTKEYKHDRFTIEQKIFNIFNSKDYIYKADVIIVTDNQVLQKRIIGKNSDNLITIDNEYIPISIIKDIYKK